MAFCSAGGDRAEVIPPRRIGESQTSERSRRMVARMRCAGGAAGESATSSHLAANE